MKQRLGQRGAGGRVSSAHEPYRHGPTGTPLTPLSHSPSPPSAHPSVCPSVHPTDIHAAATLCQAWHWGPS